MAYPAKIDLALQILAKTKISRSNYAPPLHRLLWSFGIPVRPPHFAGFWSNFLQGTAWGILLYPPIAWLISSNPIRSIVTLTLFVGTLTGLIFAIWIQRSARRYKLPDWSEIGVPERFD
jgi:hypothetical protein